MESRRAPSRKQSKKNKSRPPRGTLQGPPKMRIQEISNAVGTFISEPTWLRFEGKTTHPELGGGVRIAGRQLLTSLATTAADAQLFIANGATLASINSIFLSPDTLNGRIALQARNYDRYVFRKVKLTYVPRVPTTQVGSFALGYVADPIIPSPTFSTVTSMCPAIQRTFYGDPSSIIIVDDMNTWKTYFTLYDATDVSSKRQTVQGCVVGMPDQSSIGALTQGHIWIDYLIDLYQPTMDQAFTIRLTRAEEESILKARSEAPPVKIASSDISSEIGALQLRLQQLKTGNLNL